MEWYDSLFDIAGDYFTARLGGPSGFVNGGGATTAPPIVIDRGRAAPCKRRRRRRLLTDQDFSDLVKISTLGNSKNVQVALAKAVRR